MEQLLFSLNSTIPVFLVMVLGYFLKQIRMVDDSFVKTLNKFNYTVTLPFLVFKDLSGPDAHGLDKASLKKALKGIVTNPILIGIALGVLASMCRLDFPLMIDKTINNVAALASPLALIGLGAGFEGRKALKQLLPTAVASALKLVILPAFFLPLAIHLGFTQEKLVAILVMLGSPTTASCYILAKNMGHEGTLTSSTVVATTFLSSITLTAWLFILRSMGLI